MRRMVGLMVLALPLALLAGPTQALDRLPGLGDTSLVVRIADLDRPGFSHRYDRTDAYWHWRHRAAYTRWIHDEYVRAGYPVRHRHSRIYRRTHVCCDYYRH